MGAHQDGKIVQNGKGEAGFTWDALDALVAKEAVGVAPEMEVPAPFSPSVLADRKAQQEEEGGEEAPVQHAFVIDDDF